MRKKLKYTKTISLRFLSITIAMCLLLYLITMVGSGILYSNVLESRYANLCRSASRVVSGSIEADKINIWLNGEDTHGYVQATNKLEELSNDISTLENIAIYQMREDGMYTVYNTKSTLIRRDLGNVVSYDSKWGNYKEDFLAGKPVDKILVNGYKGPTMTYCTPIYDSEGNCVAHVCSGISMQSINMELRDFLTSLGKILLVIIFVLFMYIFIYVRVRIVNPVNQIGSAMLNPVRKGSVELMRRLATNEYYSTKDIKIIFRSASKVFAEKNGIKTINSELQEEVMNAFATIVNRSNNESEIYADHVGACTRILCEKLMECKVYPETITPAFCRKLEYAAPLHDIGKLTVPDEVIYKPDTLTAEEFNLIKNHSQNGALIIEKAKKKIKKRKKKDFLDIAAEVALYHHENWNGGGYPMGLISEEIPISARIVAIVDAYDAITRQTCYHKASTPTEAYEILRGDRNKFDPEIFECFEAVRNDIVIQYS